MNRLIIIGNGFDLAHGIKTSYKDFIEDYLCNVINSFFDKQTYLDDLIEIQFRTKDLFYRKPPKLVPSQAIDMIKGVGNVQNIICTFHSQVLWNSLNKIDQMNWVDSINTNDKIPTRSRKRPCRKTNRHHLSGNKFCAVLIELRL